MKRKILLIMLTAIAAVCLFAFAGCGNEEEKPNDTSYTIQYFDGTKNNYITVKEGDLYDIPVPEKKGYNFLGLFTDEVGGVKYVNSNGSCTMPFSGSANMILYAQYEAKTYTVVYDYDKAGNDAYTCSVAYGETLPMPAAPSYVYGSEFVGWYTNKDMGGTKVSSASAMDYEKGILSYDNFDLDKLTGGRLVLYAGFKLNVYEVKFYSADGRDLITTKNIQHGTAVTKLGGITHNGKTVLEWGRTVNGTPVTGEITESTNLYAVKYGINIKFNSDGGNAVSLGIVAVGNTVTLPQPERQYARFVCWTENGEPVDNNYTVPDRAVTLTAKWEITHYKVKYVSEGGEINSEMVEIGTAVSLPTLTKTYYKFNGWSYNGSLIEDGMVMPEKNITLTAQWERTHYEVKYVSEGGEINSEMVEIGAAVSLPLLTKTNYKFNGWSYNGSLIEDGMAMPEKDITLTAQWERSHYSITYNTNDGEDPVSVVVAKGTSVTLPTPSKAYYIFGGWEYNGKKIDGNSVIPEDDMTLSASWEKEFKDYKYISTAQDFVDIKNDVNGKYMLIADLDLSKVERDPLVTFGGEFKGNNHTIELGNREHLANMLTENNKYCNTKGNIDYGWFAGNNTGTISDFTVKNLVCKSKEAVRNGTYWVIIGGICGWNSTSGTISNVKIENSVSGSASNAAAQIVSERNNSRCGGICGENAGTITNCNVTALVFGEGLTGGIAGWTNNKILNCKFNGKIGMYLSLNAGKTVLRCWGGIVGYAYSASTVNISGCSVTSCSFEYYGENSAYHNSTHYYCSITPWVGIICGWAFTSGTFSGNTYSNCSKALVLKGGNNHYGSHEKSNLFQKQDGMMGNMG